MAMMPPRTADLSTTLNADYEALVKDAEMWRSLESCGGWVSLAETLRDQRDHALFLAEDRATLSADWEAHFYAAEQRAAAWRAVALLSLLFSGLLLAAAILAAWGN